MLCRCQNRPVLTPVQCSRSNLFFEACSTARLARWRTCGYAYSWGWLMRASVSGLNHITLAVADVERSVAFYRDVLGCVVRAV